MAVNKKEKIMPHDPTAERFIKLSFALNKKREDVKIQTKFKDIKDFQKNGRAVKGEASIVSTTKYGEISGDIKKSGVFELSSTKKTSSMYKYIGEATETENGVELKGNIIPKKLSGKMLKVNLVLVLAVIAIFSYFMVTKGYDGTYWVLVLFFIALPTFQLSNIITDNSLYKDIVHNLEKDNE